MIVNILSHTPVWVWGLLSALMALCLSQTRQRQLAPWRLLMLPLVLLGLGLWSMAPGFIALPLTALVWLAALGVGVALLAGRPARAGAAAYFSPSWTAFQADRGRRFSGIVDGVSV